MLGPPAGGPGKEIKKSQPAANARGRETIDGPSRDVAVVGRKLDKCEHILLPEPIIDRCRGT